MPRDGSGNYVLPAGNPVVSNTTISTVWANATLGDIANALTDSIPRDGTAGPTGPFKLQDGSVVSPGLQFASEPGLGLARTAAGTLTFAASNASLFVLAASGALLNTSLTVTSPGGIKSTQTLGGTDPATCLTLENTANHSAGRGCAIAFVNRLDNGATQNTFVGAKIAAVQTSVSASGDNDLVISTADNQVLGEAVRITTAKRVGIGAPAPISKLHANEDTDGISQITISNNKSSPAQDRYTALKMGYGAEGYGVRLVCADNVSNSFRGSFEVQLGDGAGVYYTPFSIAKNGNATFANALGVVGALTAGSFSTTGTISCTGQLSPGSVVTAGRVYTSAYFETDQAAVGTRKSIFFYSISGDSVSLNDCNGASGSGVAALNGTAVVLYGASRPIRLGNIGGYLEVNGAAVSCTGTLAASGNFTALGNNHNLGSSAGSTNRITFTKSGPITRSIYHETDNAIGFLSNAGVFTFRSYDNGNALVQNNLTAGGSITASTGLVTLDSGGLCTVWLGAAGRQVRKATATNNIEFVNQANTTITHTFSDAGTSTCTDWIATSDASLKHNIQDRWLPLDSITMVPPRSWNWNSDGSPSSGVIAQELQGLLPELVHADSNGKLSVSEGKAALVIALSLAREVAALRAELAELKK